MHWRVVGFQHRMGVEPAARGGDEHFGWREYLLWPEAWLRVSWSIPRLEHGAPTADAPQMAAQAAPPRYQPGHQVRPEIHLRARPPVLGEFC